MFDLFWMQLTSENHFARHIYICILCTPAYTFRKRDKNNIKLCITIVVNEMQVDSFEYFVLNFIHLSIIKFNCRAKVVFRFSFWLEHQVNRLMLFCVIFEILFPLISYSGCEMRLLYCFTWWYSNIIKVTVRILLQLLMLMNSTAIGCLSTSIGSVTFDCICQ